MLGEQLHGDVALQPRVEREVDGGHAADPEAPLELVPPGDPRHTPSPVAASCVVLSRCKRVESSPLTACPRRRRPFPREVAGGVVPGGVGVVSVGAWASCPSASWARLRVGRCRLGVGLVSVGLRLGLRRGRVCELHAVVAVACTRSAPWRRSATRCSSVDSAAGFDGLLHRRSVPRARSRRGPRAPGRGDRAEVVRARRGRPPLTPLRAGGRGAARSASRKGRASIEWGSERLLAVLEALGEGFGQPRGADRGRGAGDVVFRAPASGPRVGVEQQPGGTGIPVARLADAPGVQQPLALGEVGISPVSRGVAWPRLWSRLNDRRHANGRRCRRAPAARRGTARRAPS